MTSVTTSVQKLSAANGQSRGSQENLYTSEDEEEISDEENRLPSVQGCLNKWTNLLHGWQERFFVLKDGVLSYFRSSDEMGMGCRGAIRLKNAFVRPHEYDECRFEVRVGDSIWYLRGQNIEERHEWIQAIERHRIAESGYGSTEQNLGRHSSLISINSAASVSIASASSFKRGHGLTEKLAEMETFKEILCKQVDSLQGYFDACSSIVRHKAHDQLELELMDDLDSDNLYDNTHCQDEHLLPTSKLRMLQADTASICTSSSGGGCLPEDFATDDTGGFPPINDSTSVHSLPPLPPSSLNVRGHRRVGSLTTALSRTWIGKESGDVVEVDEEAIAEQEKKTVVSSNRKETQTTSTTDDAQGDAVTPTSQDSSREQVAGAFVVPPAADTEVPQSLPAPNSQPPPQTQQRGFLSRFFPFRSAVSVVPPAVLNDSTSGSNAPPKYETQQYRPSSRFNDLKRILEQHGGHAIDFKGEAYTFKATTTGILTNLNHCIDLMHQREEQWRKRLEREIERRRRAEEAYRNLAQDLNRMQPKMIVLGGPDFEEGPNCSIGEEEFFDAIDAQLDKMESDDERLEALKQFGSEIRNQGSLSSSHPLWEEVNRIVREHIEICDPAARELKPEDGWQIIAEDGEMIIYKREMENSEGLVVDPLQAVHTVEGVTARELCTYFWDVQYRMDWEITVDQPPIILEACGDDTIVQHQIYKRVWPASQRDSVFWSHIRKVDLPIKDGEQCPYFDTWMVTNYSTNHKAPNLEDLPNKMIRLELNVAFICQTIIDNVQPGEDVTSIPRDRVRSKLLYTSTINPGGWAPASVLRTMAKREYPRFIKRFSQYVVDQTTNKPILL